MLMDFKNPNECEFNRPEFWFDYSSCDKYSNDFLTKEFENLCVNIQSENQTVLF